MKNVLLNLAAIVLGAVLGSVVNMALVTAGHAVFPLPAGIDPNNLESFRASAHLLTPGHFLFPFLAHAAGTLVGALVAFLIAGSHRCVLACVIGVLFLAGGIAAAFMIPAPAWFLVLDLLVAYLPMACLAMWLGVKIRPGPASP